MIKFKKNKKNKKNKKAFSFMELLTTIIIIGIIISTATVSFRKIRENSRDTKRIADIKQIQSALELYYSDNGKYPETLGSSISSGTKIYLEEVPKAVTPADGDCSEEENNYSYVTSDDNNNYYYLSFCIGKDMDDYDSGNKIAVPGDILEPIDIYLCGQDFKDTRDGKYYSTLQFGSQCWMTENMNIGTFINNGSAQSNNSVIEKYCYGNDESDCNVYGGLYQWNEAMQYIETEESQGICPDGWHIPSNEEWRSLVAYVNNNPDYLCNDGAANFSNGKAFASNFGWTPDVMFPCTVGNNQETNNATGFNILPVGFCSSAFFDRGYSSHFWSSSSSGDVATDSFTAWQNVNFFPDNFNYKVFGFSVRCILD